MTTRKTLAAIPLILLPLGVLAAWLQAAEDPPTELYVRTTPPGATLFLDGKPLGASPDVFEVPPGEHELLAVLEGHKSAKREIVVPATRIKRVILTLEKAPPTSPPANTVAQSLIERKLARRFPGFDCKKIPLDKLLEELGREAKVNIMLDPRSLSDQRISPYTPITLELRDVSLAEVLEAALTPLDLEYTILDEVIAVRAVETFFLPNNEETHDAGRVLDLASGETLVIVGENGFHDLREFTRQHGQGDLYFGHSEEDGGSFIGCMRGATAVIRDADHTRPLGPSQKREDVTVYRLPALPCRLLITTAEEKVFDVSLLSTVESEESEDGFPLYVSGIRLKYEKVEPEVPVSPDQSTSETKIADEILRPCAEAVWTELPGKLRGAERGEVEKIAAQFTAGLVAQHILPHADEVVAHLLAELPKAEPIDLSQWTVKQWARSPQGELMDSQPRASAWNAMAGDWNPMAVFWIVWKEVMTEELGSESFGKLCLLQARVPVGSVLLDSRIDRPVIAKPLGDELFVAHLERPDGVHYRCREFQWLQRKPGEAPWSIPVASSDASEGQKLVRSFTDAVWAQLAPRLDELSHDQITEEIDRLAEEYFQGHEDELSREVDRVLAQAPQAEPLDLTRWVSRLSESDREKVNVLLEEVKKKSLAQPFSPHRFWDPMFRAQTISMSCTMGPEGYEALAARITLAAASFHSMHSVWRIDPDHVAIVQGTGDRITVVYLERTSEGWYLPTDFDALARADSVQSDDSANSEPIVEKVARELDKESISEIERIPDPVEATLRQHAEAVGGEPREWKEDAAELRRLRDQVGELTISDPAKVHAIGVPTVGEMNWRWRVYLPADRQFDLFLIGGRVRMDGVPERGKAPSMHSPIHCSGEFLLSANVRKDYRGEWVLAATAPDWHGYTPLENDEWLNRGGHMIVKIEPGKTQSVGPGKPMVLVRLLVDSDGKPPETPCDGLMIVIKERQLSPTNEGIPPRESQ